MTQQDLPVAQIARLLAISPGAESSALDRALTGLSAVTAITEDRHDR